MRCRNHPDRSEPFFHELWPLGNRKIRSPQAKRVAAVRVQMQLGRNAGILQRDIVSDGLVYAVHVVVFGLDQKRWRVWRVTGTFGFNL